MPERITPELIAQAKRALPAADEALRPAPRQKVKDWLALLGTLCAGQTTAADAKAKISAYAPLLDVPDVVLNRHTLREAGERFKWFPSYSEISEFLSERVTPMRQLRARLDAIANALPSLPPPPERRWSDLTDEEKAAHDRMMETARAKLHAKEPTPLAQAISIPPELRRAAEPRSPDAKALVEGGLLSTAPGSINVFDKDGNRTTLASAEGSAA